MTEIPIITQKVEELVDLTDAVRRAVAATGVRDGACVVSSPHTTAGVTINEGADPSVARDLLVAIGGIVPDLRWAHAEGNSPAHVKAALVGASVTVPVVDGALALGTWQSIFLCEFDGPRERRIRVTVLS